MSGIFRGMQPIYAEHGIATFPVAMVGDRKKPLVSHYERVGLRASTEFAKKFGDATMLGFVAGRRNGITLFDYDVANDERGFAAALDHFGDSPLKVRTASGKFHALYRYNGEGRRVRQLGELPVDILGGGVIVGAGSVIPGKGTYEIIEGSLADIPYLPKLRNLPPWIYEAPANDPSPTATAIITEGKRDHSLFRDCLGVAATTRGISKEEGFVAVLRAANEFNAKCDPPLEEAEVMHAVNSAWDYEIRGLNRVGQHGVWFETSEANALITSDQDAFVLLSYRRAHNGPDRIYMCANGLHEVLGWRRQRLAAARDRLIGRKDIIVFRYPSRHLPGLFRWPKRKRPSR